MNSFYAELFQGNTTTWYIYIFFLFSTQKWHMYLKSFLIEDKYLFILKLIL